MPLLLNTQNNMYERELSVALDAAKLAAKKIMEVYNSGDIGVEIKEDNSPVTKADKAADKIISEALRQNFPDYSLLTEESIDNKKRLQNDYVWIVDPVDGTKDFVAHNDEFTINIGLAYKHQSVLGVILIPATGEIYYATKNGGAYYLNNNVSVRIHCNDKLDGLTVLLSNFHTNQAELEMIDKHSDKIKYRQKLGSSIKGCFIARGKAEVHYRFSSNTKEWDTCAMQAIVEEAGGFLLKFDGTPIVYNREDVYNKDGYVICNRRENFLL